VLDVGEDVSNATCVLKKEKGGVSGEGGREGGRERGREGKEPLLHPMAVLKKGKGSDER